MLISGRLLLPCYRYWRGLTVLLGGALTLVLAYHYFTSSVLLFDLQTNYLHWSSHLPAIAVCEVSSPISVARLKSVRGLRDLAPDLLARLVDNIMTPNSLIPSLELFPWAANLTTLLLQVSTPCEKLLVKCKWNDEEIDCCQQFRPMLSPRGLCYAVNSAMTSAALKSGDFRLTNLFPVTTELYYCFRPSYSYKVSNFAPDAVFRLELSTPFKVLLTDRRSVGWEGDEPGTVGLGESVDIVYRVREVIADPTASWVPLASRGCALNKDLPRHSYPVYSQNGCRYTCSAKMQGSACGCTHYLYPPIGQPQCDGLGYSCLASKVLPVLVSLNSSGATSTLTARDKLDIHCNCFPTCDEVEPSLVSARVRKVGGNQSAVSVSLGSLPTERLIVRARMTPLEALVAVACLTRLFTSVSWLHLPQLVFSTAKKPQLHDAHSSILY